MLNALNYILFTPQSTLVARQLTYNADMGATGLHQTAVVYTDVQADCVDGGVLTSTTGIRDWMKTTLAKCVLTTAVEACYKPTASDPAYATLAQFGTALGMATLVNGVLTAVTTAIGDRAIAAALGKCMKLSGDQTLTGNIYLSRSNN